jgi:nucleotide-binding universal stress UspA family protein
VTTTRPDAPIVVGVDGSPDAARAVEWAARLAAVENRPLTLLHAGVASPESPVLDEAVASASRTLPRSSVRAVAVADPPRQALIDASREASMVAIGGRGVGALSRLRIGSVAHALTRQASCPVVVTRTAGAHRRPGVVAGIDLGPCTPGVLDLAFRVAADRSWPLTVLHCFWDETRGTGDLSPEAALAQPQRRMVDHAVRDHAARYPEVDLDTVLYRGFADRRLLTATLDTGLVVIGHRELPWLESLVYGHVTPVVVEHAVGDIAVVPCVPPGEVWS